MWPSVVHDVDGGQMMALGEGEVVGVVGRSDLDRAGAEVAADPLVEDDGISRFISGRRSFLPCRLQVALVFRMNGNGYVAEHGLGAGGCDRQKLAGILTVNADNRVANLP
jgi:CBS domain-containing protein